MAEYKLTNTEKIKHWKEVILSYLAGKDTKKATPQEFLAVYPHAELTILQSAVAELISEGKIHQV